MTITLAFDVYGTLIDTNGVVEVLHNIVGDKAGDFSRSWREKQLEYSFRRGLMKKYETSPFVLVMPLITAVRTIKSPLAMLKKMNC